MFSVDQVQNSIDKETHCPIAVRVLQKSLCAALPHVIVAICHDDFENFCVVIRPRNLFMPVEGKVYSL
jgi:hypothetical protein